MLVQVRYRQQQKYVKLDEVDGQFDFMQLHEKVIERFCLPPDAKVVYKDATGTEVDEDIFNDLVSQGSVVLTVFPSDEFTDCSLSSPSEWSDSSFSSSASTVLLDEIPRKKSRVEGTINAVSAKKLIEAVLGASSGGEEVLEEYHASQTLKDSTRRKLVNIIVAHMIDKHGHLPTKAVREEYALGIVTLFPSLKDPYSEKGYEHFYDAASSTGYISWRLKTIQRKIRRESTTSNSLTGLCQGGGGPKFQRSVVVEEQQLDGDACQEAMSLLNYATDTTQIFRKMRETFQHRQKLINDSDKTLDILSIFPRFLDTKGLVNQDFILLFNDEVSNRLLQKWDPIFRCNVIKEAKQLTSTPELRQLLHSAESPQGSHEAMTYDAEMASLLLLLYLLPPPPGGPKFPKISASDAVEKVIVFHKSCCSLEEHLQNQQNHQPYLLAVGREKRNIDRFYISIDKRLIPCQANRSLGAFDELFKAHFVFSVSYDGALLNFYTFLQTTVYNIDMGKMKVSPRIRDMRAKLLNKEVLLTTQI
ncbi:uncharacterized protein LOC111948039 isoform X1 [Oryzias latipes]|uniref:uncharacterized protein LOC111948039 isoform X1 n=1 Tax=Oryzias latipes TaxID=8090 RepID=UPI000CE1BBD6|nr:uncharacterized protein LOC111948039 isoform X1 [Oryzias latipes]